MSNVIPFKFKENDIRVVTGSDGQLWFVAKDVCDVLGYSNPSKSLGDHLDIDERSNVQLGRQGKTNIINESGVFALALRCTKPEAKPFRKWVTSEVLPSIRKTGSFSVSGSLPNFGNPAEAAEAWAKQYRLTQRAEIEKTLAIATKAEIGSRREATAMATASKQKRRANQLEKKLGDNRDWKQVKAISWLRDVFASSRGMYSQVGRKLSQLSEEMERKPKNIEDTEYGTVKAYHVEVISEFYERLNHDSELLSKYRIMEEAV